MKVTVPEISFHNRDPILSVDVQHNSPDGITRMATGGTDTHVVVWQISTLPSGGVGVEALCDLVRHNRAVNAVRFSPDGQLLASADDEAAIIVWKRQDASVAGAPDLFAEDGEEKNKESWIIHKMLRGHIEDVYDLCWSSCSTYIVSGSIDNSAIMWDVNKGKNIGLLKDHKNFVQGVAWDPLNQFVVTLSSDRVLRWFSVHSKRVLHKAHKATLPKISDKGVVKEVSTRLFYDDTLKSFCRRLSFSPDGLLLAAPSGILEDEQPGARNCNAVHIFTRLSPTKPVMYLPTKDKYTLAVRFCPLLFKLRPGKPDTPHSGQSVFALPYRMVLAVACQNSVVLYDTQQLVPFAKMSNMHYTRLTDLAWSADGRILAISSTDGYCSLTSFNEGELGEVYSETKQCQNVTPCKPDKIAVTPRGHKSDASKAKKDIMAPKKETESSCDTKNTNEGIVKLKQEAMKCDESSVKQESVKNVDTKESSESNEEDMDVVESLGSKKTESLDTKSISPSVANKSKSIEKVKTPPNKTNILIARRAPKPVVRSACTESAKPDAILNKTSDNPIGKVAAEASDSSGSSSSIKANNARINEGAGCSKMINEEEIEENIDEEDIEDKENIEDEEDIIASDDSESLGSNDSEEEEEEEEDDNDSVRSFDDDACNAGKKDLEDDIDMGVSKIVDDDDCSSDEAMEVDESCDESSKKSAKCTKTERRLEFKQLNAKCKAAKLDSDARKSEKSVTLSNEQPKESAQQHRPLKSDVKSSPKVNVIAVKTKPESKTPRRVALISLSRPGAGSASTSGRADVSPAPSNKKVSSLFSLMDVMTEDTADLQLLLEGDITVTSPVKNSNSEIVKNATGSTAAKQDNLSSSGVDAEAEFHSPSRVVDSSEKNSNAVSVTENDVPVAGDNKKTTASDSTKELAKTPSGATASGSRQCTPSGVSVTASGTTPCRSATPCSNGKAPRRVSLITLASPKAKKSLNSNRN